LDYAKEVIPGCVMQTVDEKREIYSVLLKKKDSNGLRKEREYVQRTLKTFFRVKLGATLYTARHSSKSKKGPARCMMCHIKLDVCGHFPDCNCCPIGSKNHWRSYDNKDTFFCCGCTHFNYIDERSLHKKDGKPYRSYLYDIVLFSLHDFRSTNEKKRQQKCGKYIGAKHAGSIVIDECETNKNSLWNRLPKDLVCWFSNMYLSEK
jgi:hypothetical protein